jgi:hypothetical protein
MVKPRRNQNQVTLSNTKVTNSLDGHYQRHQSWFLETPLVRQADGELKKGSMTQNNLFFEFLEFLEILVTCFQQVIRIAFSPFFVAKSLEDTKNISSNRL